MKKFAWLITAALLISILGGCQSQPVAADIAATTLPVYQFTVMLCQGTGLTVARLVNENVSCLHDYSLNVSQVKAVESATLVVINGAGLEEFMEDLLHDKPVIDASANISPLESCHGHQHSHQEEDHGGHELDSHIWLSPLNAMIMAENICQGLKAQYPQHSGQFDANLQILLQKLQELHDYGTAQLQQLSCRELITFHDGFSYLADCYGLTILAAVEEESGSEASAKELIELIEIVRHHGLPAVFIEENGSVSAAHIIAAETGTQVFTLHMAMAGDDYFAAMYHNIQSIKEALG